MSAIERLNRIDERHAAWYDGDLGRAEWADCTADEAADADEDTLARLMAARMIVRNDVPVLVAALRAVLDMLDPHSGLVWSHDLYRDGMVPVRDIRRAIATALGVAS